MKTALHASPGKDGSLLHESLFLLLSLFLIRKTRQKRAETKE